MTSAGRALPAGLRARVLEASRRARQAGTTVPEVPEVTPVEAFSSAAGALYRTLSALPDDDWRRPAIRDLDVQGLVGHLIGVEEDMRRALAGDPAVGHADHVRSTQAAADRQAGRDPAQTLGEWHRAVERTLSRVAAIGDPGVIVALHGFPLPLHVWLVARAFELWTHENDIRASTGLPPSAPDTPVLAAMTRLVAGMLPLAAMGTGFGPPARLHLVLTGPGGGTWDMAVGGQAPPEPVQVSIVADAIRFCRLVGNRADPAGIDAHITGDHAAAAGILAAAATLALD